MNSYEMYERIQRLILEKGITVAELERRVGVSNATISRWQKSIPSADKLQRVAKELGTTMDYLVTGNEEDTQSKIIAREASGLTDSQVALIRNMIKEFKERN